MERNSVFEYTAQQAAELRAALIRYHNPTLSGEELATSAAKDVARLGPDVAANALRQLEEIRELCIQKRAAKLRQDLARTHEAIIAQAKEEVALRYSPEQLAEKGAKREMDREFRELASRRASAHEKQYIAELTRDLARGDVEALAELELQRSGAAEDMNATKRAIRARAVAEVFAEKPFLWPSWVRAAVAQVNGHSTTAAEREGKRGREVAARTKSRTNVAELRRTATDAFASQPARAVGPADSETLVNATVEFANSVAVRGCTREVRASFVLALASMIGAAHTAAGTPLGERSCSANGKPLAKPLSTAVVMAEAILEAPSDRRRALARALFRGTMSVADNGTAMAQAYRELGALRAAIATVRK